MFDPGSIAAILGISARNAASNWDLAQSVERGLPLAALDKLAVILAPNNTQAIGYRFVPKATLERKRQKKAPLTPQESDKVVRVAKVAALALNVFRDEDKVRDFLTRSHMMLEDRTPLDLALSTGAGADAVMTVLGRGAFGSAV